MAAINNETYWPEFKTLAEKGQYQEIVEMIQKIPGSKERVGLLRFAVRSLMFRDWSSKSLVPILLLGDLAIETAMESGDIEEANVICYNMSANLADCWDDGFIRNRENFDKGLQYAKRALEFRRQLKKGPGPFSLAYWAQGIHQYLLGDLSGAEKSFLQSLNAAVEAARAEQKEIVISKNAPFSVLIGFGYLAIARIAQGSQEAQATYNQVMTAFEQMKGISEDAKGDAEIGLKQLRFVHSKLLFSRA